MLELNIDSWVGFRLVETKAWDRGRREAGIQSSEVEVSSTLTGPNQRPGAFSWSNLRQPLL